jgi:hypothetical protein
MAVAGLNRDARLEPPPMPYYNDPESKFFELLIAFALWLLVVIALARWVIGL